MMCAVHQEDTDDRASKHTQQKPGEKETETSKRKMYSNNWKSQHSCLINSWN